MTQPTVSGLPPPQEIHHTAGQATARRSDQNSQALDLIANLNQEYQEHNPATASFPPQFWSYELAYQMQIHATELINISKESLAHRVFAVWTKRPR